MIKIGGMIELDETKKIRATKYILTADNKIQALDETQLIPIQSGRLVPNATISVNELGKQLLKCAADGEVEEIKTLLTKGAPFTADWLGTSPLHLAAQNNHLEICEILLRAGISKDARTKVDRTPLHIAAYEGHLEIVKTLVRHGTDIDCRDLLGMTPLHWAAQNGHFPIVEFLLNSGSQIDRTNKFNLSAADIAAQIGRDDISQYISNYADQALNNSDIAAQNLVFQLQSENADDVQFTADMDTNDNHITVPVEPIIISDFDDLEMEDSHQSIEEQDPDQFYSESSTNNDQENITQNIDEHDNSFSAIKLLQEHGITMLPNDDNDESNILNSVMESGHSVVLTDVGKEVLNSVKQLEQTQVSKKIITVTPEEFLAMTNGNLINGNVLSKIKVLPMKQGVKRIVMKKNRVVPVTSVVSTMQNDQKETESSNDSNTDMELVMSQLIEARKTIEEYKIKLHKKEQEAERYKAQLKMFLDAS